MTQNIRRGSGKNATQILIYCMFEKEVTKIVAEYKRSKLTTCSDSNQVKVKLYIAVSQRRKK
jgi:tRNA 2-selenouridine synthase SelU